MLEPFEAWCGPKNAKCVFVGEAFGREEDAQREPFVGASGKEFWLMLGEAAGEAATASWHRATELHKYGNAWIRARQEWMTQEGIAFTNVLNFRPPDNKIPSLCVKKAQLPSWYDWPALSTGNYLDPQYLPEIERLHKELFECRPNLIVAMGNTATWALLRATNIGSIRGTITQSINLWHGGAGEYYCKCLPTFHPASVLYMWAQRPIVVADLMKARREVQYIDIRRPSRIIHHSLTLEEFHQFVDHMLTHPPELLSCDTETSMNMIDTISFAPSKDEAWVVQLGPHRYRSGQNYITSYPMRDGQRVANYFTLEEECEFWDLVQQLLGSGIPLLFQNGIYDFQYLYRTGIRPLNMAEDQMLLHHSLYPELQKGLGFQGSIYTSEPAWKLMHRQRNDTTKADE